MRSGAPVEWQKSRLRRGRRTVIFGAEFAMTRSPKGTVDMFYESLRAELLERLLSARSMKAETLIEKADAKSDKVRRVALLVPLSSCPMSEADDLVQDVFLLVHRDSKAFDSAKGTLRAWIFQMAYRRAISRHRYLSSRHFYNRVDPDDVANELGDPRTGTGQARNEIGEMFGEEALQRLFEELSPNQRETLISSYPMAPSTLLRLRANGIPISSASAL
jgi:DNA-directed RNA polymerase specialized sigma24 family protein